MTREQEAMIVRKVLQGDVNAFEKLVTEYEKAVYAIALRMTGNAEDAADMTQEAFIKAYNSLSSFRGDSKFSVWLYRIANNVCLDFLRSRSRRPRKLSRSLKALASKPIRFAAKLKLRLRTRSSKCVSPSKPNAPSV